jgi:hypothetical protein
MASPGTSGPMTAQWSALARVQDPALLGRIRRGELSEREHHAGRDFARGYCLFNDIALAVDIHAATVAEVAARVSA